MKNNQLTILALAVIPVLGYGQDPGLSRPVDFEKIADEIFAQQDLDLNYEELYENLSQRLSSPLNINTASREELLSLFVLNELQVNDLLLYRDSEGELLSLYELQILSSFDAVVVRRLAPFVVVMPTARTKKLLGRIFSEDNNYLLIRNERRLGSLEGFGPETDSVSRFQGSPDKLYLRFRVSHPADFSVGATMEKDAGEPFTWTRARRGFDYYSVHAQVMNQGRLKNLIVGDFQAQFGQGLLLGGGLGMGKGSETITTMRRSTVGFLPYTSVNESGFFRGAAVTYAPARWVQVHAFGSTSLRDANMSADSTSVSLLESGFHRNSKELTTMKEVEERNAGFIIEHRGRLLQAGVLAHHANWQLPVIKAPTLYNQFDPQGAAIQNVGAFGSYSHNNFSFFGEIGQTMHGGRGLVLGSLGSLSRNFDVSLVLRRYDRNFKPVYGNAVAENSVSQNENGLYWGWKHQVSRRVAWSGYVDLFTFPWLRYRDYSPSTGHEVFARFNWTPSKTIVIFLQAREERKERNGPEGQLYKTVETVKRNYSLNADYTLGKLSFKTRLQMSTQRIIQESVGFAIIQDVQFDGNGWGLSLRQALYDTDDYDNRQYAYERDMWMAFSFPAYYGSGMRTLAMLRVSISKTVTLWVRWAGTASVAADGPPDRNDLKVQVRFRL